MILTYQNGNLTQRRTIHYDPYTTPAVLIGTDSLTFIYDNTSWHPEAAYLYEVGNTGDIKTGKPNKNNVIGIQCKMFNSSYPEVNAYTAIQYVYTTKGPKIMNVDMTGTTTKGFTIKTPIVFGYKCD
jgi:hypothetical protein